MTGRRPGRWRAWLLPCLGLLMAVQAGAETPPPAAKPVFRIAGTVVNRRNGSPIAHCRLTATQNGLTSDISDAPPDQDRGGNGFRGGFAGVRSRRMRAGGNDTQEVEAVYSDDAGHFSLTVPSAGVWKLTGSARGYHQQSYEQQENFWSGIVLSTATPELTVRFGMYSDSSIAGIVYDEAGEPVRNALVRVEPVQHTAANEGIRRRVQIARTDDRGRYEVAELSPGDYRVGVNAQPWYAARGIRHAATDPGSSLDPSLDLVYAETWYPAAADRESSDPVILGAGEEREADFHLTPIPSIHLRIPQQQPPGDGGDENTRRFGRAPTVQRDGGSSGPGPMTTSVDGKEWDIGGLTPGTYQVRTPNPGGAGERLSTLTLASGSPAVVAATSAMAATSLTVTVDGVDPEAVRQINLVDATSRQSFGTAERGQPGGEGEEDSRQTGARTINAPPGRYEIFLQGKPGLYLTGLTATGAKAEGRTIELGGGSPKLTVHAAIGLSEVEGVARMDGKPLPSAMVLLVPAGYGQTRNVAPLRRDETNTDGSFDLRNVFPGEYILVAIDHGWEINWRDSATLDSYLTKGTPLNLQPAGTARKTLDAIEP